MPVSFVQLLIASVLFLGTVGLTGCATHQQAFVGLPFFEAKSDTIPGLLTPEERKEKIREKIAKGSEESPQVQEMVARQMLREYRSVPDPIIRRQIVESIPRLQAPSRQTVLREALEDPDVFVRISACIGWGEQQSPEASQTLRNVVENDEDTDVRIAAARQLGHFQGPEVKQSLGKALESREPALRYQAMESLARCTGEDFGRDVKRWKQYLNGERPDPPEKRPLLQQIGLSSFPTFF
jgi:hypothetical protein